MTKVHILLPDLTIATGTSSEETYEGLFEVILDDGRVFYRDNSSVFEDENIARATKFKKRYKIMLRGGVSPIEVWNSESKKIVDLAIDLWPEEFL